MYKWMGVPAKAANFIMKLMEEWKTRLEVTDDRKVLKSRSIIIMKSFFQGDSHSPIWFCLTEVYISLLIEENYWYIIGQGDRRREITKNSSCE